MKRFIAIQTGARRNYAVPAILEQTGMLEAFYTDLCADAGLGAWLDRYVPPKLRQGQLNQFLNRRLPVNLKGKVRTCDRAALKYLFKQKIAGKNRLKQHQALMQFDQEFSRVAIRDGFGQATHVFSMFGEGTNLLACAKQQGLKTITEIYISPMTHAIVQAERESFPDLEPALAPEIIERDYEWFYQVCQQTDIFLTPSKFVNEGLREFNINQDDCRIVPYGVSDSWFQIHNHPARGRILFVGTAEIRKGIHILGMVAEQLNCDHYKFVVAGGVSDRIRHHPLTRRLIFLGRVPRTEIQKEYAQADIFVLPSLAEGSAEVIYEALAAGLPVITTEASGSVVRHGIEGFIVPERDPEALATYIQQLVENRELREQMAIAARERAKDYTWKQYRERLLLALQID